MSSLGLTENRSAHWRRACGSGLNRSVFTPRYLTTILSSGTPAVTSCFFTNSEIAMTRSVGYVITHVRSRSSAFFHDRAWTSPLFCIS